MAPPSPMMQGNGRELGTGEMRKGKKAVKGGEGHDGEYVPSEDDEETDDEIEYDSEESALGSDSDTDDKDPDLSYIQVKEAGGRYHKVKVAQVPEEATVENKVYADSRFKKNSRRGLARFAVVIKRRMADSGGLEGESDCSVANNGRVSSQATAIIECKEGLYKAVRSKTTGQIKYKAMTKAERAKARAGDDGKPCQCVQCEIMRKNNAMMVPVGSSRLRKKKSKDDFASK